MGFLALLTSTTQGWMDVIIAYILSLITAFYYQSLCERWDNSETKICAIFEYDKYIEREFHSHNDTTILLL